MYTKLLLQPWGSCHCKICLDSDHQNGRLRGVHETKDIDYIDSFDTSQWVPCRFHLPQASPWGKVIQPEHWTYRSRPWAFAFGQTNPGWPLPPTLSCKARGDSRNIHSLDVWRSRSACNFVSSLLLLKGQYGAMSSNFCRSNCWSDACTHSKATHGNMHNTHVYGNTCFAPPWCAVVTFLLRMGCVF